MYNFHNHTYRCGHATGKDEEYVLEAIKNKLYLEKGKYTTPDGLFSLEIVSCLGACGLAPAIVINGVVHPQMTAEAVSTIIDTLMSKERE